MLHAARIAIVRRAALLRRRWRRVMVVLALLAALTTGLALFAAALAKSRPTWWAPLEFPAADLRARATQLENGAVTLMYEQRAAPDPATDPGWVAAISESDANAWLNTKMPEWARDAAGIATWPPEVREIVARFDGGRILLGVHLAKPASASGAGPADERFLCINLEPRVDAAGALWVKAVGLSIGRLPIPVALALSDSETAPLAGAARFPRSIQDLKQLAHLRSVLLGNVPLVKDPITKLGDGRTVRLRAINPSGGRLLLSCITQAKPRQGP